MATTCSRSFWTAGIAARVDLKADRQAATLKVQRAHLEPGAPRATAEQLLDELRLMARWLELDRVEIAGGGDLADSLRVA